MTLVFNFGDELVALIVNSHVWETLVGGVISGQKVLDGLRAVLFMYNLNLSQIRFLLFWRNYDFFLLYLFFGIGFWLMLGLRFRLPYVSRLAEIRTHQLININYQQYDV